MKKFGRATIHLSVLVLAVGVLAGNADAVVISTEQSDGVFSVGEPAAFVISHAVGDITITVIDSSMLPVYFGSFRASLHGTANVTIDTGLLRQAGWHQIQATSGGQSASMTFTVIGQPRD